MAFPLPLISTSASTLIGGGLGEIVVGAALAFPPLRAFHWFDRLVMIGINSSRFVKKDGLSHRG